MDVGGDGEVPRGVGEERRVAHGHVGRGQCVEDVDLAVERGVAVAGALAGTERDPDRRPRPAHPFRPVLHGEPARLTGELQGWILGHAGLGFDARHWPPTGPHRPLAPEAQPLGVTARLDPEAEHRRLHPPQQGVDRQQSEVAPIGRVPIGDEHAGAAGRLAQVLEPVGIELERALQPGDGADAPGRRAHGDDDAGAGRGVQGRHGEADGGGRIDRREQLAVGVRRAPREGQGNEGAARHAVGGTGHGAHWKVLASINRVNRPRASMR